MYETRRRWFKSSLCMAIHYAWCGVVEENRKEPFAIAVYDNEGQVIAIVFRDSVVDTNCSRDYHRSSIDRFNEWLTEQSAVNAEGGAN